MQFKVRTIMLLIVIVATLLGASISGARAFIRWRRNPYVTIRVENLTDAPLTKVVIEYAGYEWRARRIDPGGEARWRISTANGEGCFSLTFKDGSGVLRYDQCLDGVEGTERGSINVKVQNARIEKTSTIHSFFSL